MILLLAVSAAALLAVSAGGQSAPDRLQSSAAAARWQGLVGGERARVALGQRSIVLLNAPSLADRLAEAGGAATEAQMRGWTAAAVAAQKQFAAKLAGKGIAIVPELTFARVVNGFSAPLDPRGIALLERDPDVRGVYPVRAAYPASLSSRALARSGAALAAGPQLGTFDGTGITVAVLDTGIDATHPYLRERTLEGVDIVAPDGIAAPGQHPTLPGQVERHGTQLAGIVAGSRGPGGLSGTAPGARILPIRVAGWQPDAAGGYAVYGRTDQLLAGLERAVDPNADGSALDAARIALVGIAEPFASFPTGALAQAVSGAAELDTLVVAPAGNDGPAGRAYGSVSGPAGAPDALAVGAADGRAGLPTVRVLVRAGLAVLADGVVPLGGAVVPTRPLTLRLVAPRSLDRKLPPDERAAASFLDPDGFSLVAGRAALVSPKSEPQDGQRLAADAGAAAVVLERVAPAGALGLDERVGVPVVGIPSAAARAARRALADGVDVTIAIGAPQAIENTAAGVIAPFSSRGLAYGGGAKPELAAAAIAVATAEPGRNEDGTARYGTVNGTSAAAAVTAGAAALLAQARPELDARALKGALVGTAALPDDTGLTESGGALPDLTRAAATEIVAEPAALSFGPVTASDTEPVRTLVVRNVSTRRIALAVSAPQAGVAGIAIAVEPRRLSIPRGRSAEVKLRARVGFLRRNQGSAEGSIRIRGAGQALAVPWTIAFPPPTETLISDVRLSSATFRASDTAPAVLSLRVGRFEVRDGVPWFQPVERLEVELWHKRRRIGIVARLRDVLPGRFAFGITGRGPLGGRLPIGAYRVRVVATPAGGGPPASRDLSLRLR